MDLLTPLLTGSLLALFTAIQVWINKGRFDAMDRRFERLESEFAGLRSDMLQVALASKGRRDDD